MKKMRARPPAVICLLAMHFTRMWIHDHHEEVGSVPCARVRAAVARVPFGVARDATCLLSSMEGRAWAAGPEPRDADLALRVWIKWDCSYSA